MEVRHMHEVSKNSLLLEHQLIRDRCVPLHALDVNNPSVGLSMSLTFNASTGVSGAVT